MSDTNDVKVGGAVVEITVTYQEAVAKMNKAVADLQGIAKKGVTVPVNVGGAGGGTGFGGGGGGGGGANVPPGANAALPGYGDEGGRRAALRRSTASAGRASAATGGAGGDSSDLDEIADALEPNGGGGGGGGGGKGGRGAARGGKRLGALMTLHAATFAVHGFEQIEHFYDNERNFDLSAKYGDQSRLGQMQNELGRIHSYNPLSRWANRKLVGLGFNVNDLDSEEESHMAGIQQEKIRVAQRDFQAELGVNAVHVEALRSGPYAAIAGERAGIEAKQRSAFAKNQRMKEEMQALGNLAANSDYMEAQSQAVDEAAYANKNLDFKVRDTRVRMAGETIATRSANEDYRYRSRVQSEIAGAYFQLKTADPAFGKEAQDAFAASVGHTMHAAALDYTRESIASDRSIAHSQALLNRDHLGASLASLEGERATALLSVGESSRRDKINHDFNLRSELAKRDFRQDRQLTSEATGDRLAQSALAAAGMPHSEQIEAMKGGAYQRAVAAYREGRFGDAQKEIGIGANLAAAARRQLMESVTTKEGYAGLTSTLATVGKGDRATRDFNNAMASTGNAAADLQARYGKFVLGDALGAISGKDATESPFGGGSTPLDPKAFTDISKDTHDMVETLKSIEKKLDLTVR